jgi:hypothetical protein
MMLVQRRVSERGPLKDLAKAGALGSGACPREDRVGVAQWRHCLGWRKAWEIVVVRRCDCVGSVGG